MTSGGQSVLLTCPHKDTMNVLIEIVSVIVVLIVTERMSSHQIT